MRASRSVLVRPRPLLLAAAAVAAFSASPSAGAPGSPGAAGAGEVRVIPVTLVTDAGFRELRQWHGKARAALERAVADLEETLGLRFSLADETTWEPGPDVATLPQALDDAVATVGPREGLTVILVGDRFFRNQSRPDVGFSYLGRPALIAASVSSSSFRRRRSQVEHLAWMIRHELGHVFGVPHLGLSGIMEEKAEDQHWGFSEVALDIMRANRLLDFANPSPFTGSDLATLRDAYFLLDDRGETDAATLVNLGAALHREGMPDPAREAFTRAVHRDPSPAAALGLAQTVLARGDSSGARLLLGRVLERDLTPEEQGVAGSVLLSLGDFPEAERLLDAAARAHPDRFSFRFNLGLARFRQERFPEARADFEAALRGEERPEGWFNLGLTCDALEDRDCARQAFSRYLELRPEGGRAEEARKFLERQDRG